MMPSQALLGFGESAAARHTSSSFSSSSSSSCSSWSCSCCWSSGGGGGGGGGGSSSCCCSSCEAEDIEAWQEALGQTWHPIHHAFRWRRLLVLLLPPLQSRVVQAQLIRRETPNVTGITDSCNCTAAAEAAPRPPARAQGKRFQLSAKKHPTSACTCIATALHCIGLWLESTAVAERRKPCLMLHLLADVQVEAGQNDNLDALLPRPLE